LSHSPLEQLEPEEEENDLGEDLMAVSVKAMKGIEGARTMRLRGFLADQEVYMLVDLGSTNCFISEEFGARIQEKKALTNPLQVRVANGNLLQCTHELPNQM